jgi:hypothetical protein
MTSTTAIQMEFTQYRKAGIPDFLVRPNPHWRLLGLWLFSLTALIRMSSSIVSHSVVYTTLRKPLRLQSLRVQWSGSSACVRHL